jgi:hypothetical protein
MSFLGVYDLSGNGKNLGVLTKILPLLSCTALGCRCVAIRAVKVCMRWFGPRPDTRIGSVTKQDLRHGKAMQNGSR